MVQFFPPRPTGNLSNLIMGTGSIPVASREKAPTFYLNNEVRLEADGKTGEVNLKVTLVQRIQAGVDGDFGG